MVCREHKSFIWRIRKAIQKSPLKLMLGSFFHHTSFMTLPPNAILVSSHSIFLLVLLRMDGNIACLFIQFSYILTKTFIKTQGLLDIPILYCLIILVSFYSPDDCSTLMRRNRHSSSPVSAQVYRHSGICACWHS